MVYTTLTMIKNKLFIFSLLILLASCASVKKHNATIENPIAVSDLKADVDRTYNKLKRLHPLLNQYISKEELDFKFDSLKTTIIKPLNSYQFYSKLAPVIAEIRQGHITVIPPRNRYTSKEYKQIEDQEFQFNTLRFKYVEDAVVVDKVVGKDSTYLNHEVLKINDTPIDTYINRYKRLIASDGYNTTLHNHLISQAFQRFYAAEHGRVDSVQVTFKKADSIFNTTFTRVAKVKDTATVATTDTTKTVKTVLTKAEKRLAKQERKAKRKHNDNHGYIKKTKEYTRNFKFVGSDSSVAYIKIRRFGIGPYKTFYEDVFKRIADNKTGNLIIDLRNNPGGRLSEISELYSYLTDKDFQFINEAEVNSRLPFLKMAVSNGNPFLLNAIAVVISPVIIVQNLIKTKRRDGKLYYVFKQSKVQEPKPNNYKGNIYVLTNGMSFSASSILSTNLQANQRAVFVGEETGGAYNGTVAGVFKFVELPHSLIRLRIGLMQIETPYKQQPDGYGVKPDVSMYPKLSDQLQDIDTELDWVLEQIKLKSAKN